MRIAYIGQGYGTSLHRAKALGRLGYDVSLIDPWAWLGKTTLPARVHYHTGYASLALFINRRLFREVQATDPELIWVNQGEFIGPGVVRDLRKLRVPIVNYANDNPFSVENRKRFSRYRAALPFYDLVVVVFADAVAMAEQAGAQKVIRKFISADEVAHCLLARETNASHSYASEVAFVGTWMKEQRGPFMVELIKRGTPVRIWGDHWQKAPQWLNIKANWCGPGVYDNQGYAEILRSAKICLGLVNKTSNNLHTDRSIQIPALGSLLCAERTSEHLAMYEDGKEAVFWSDAAECAALCKELLTDESRRAEIACRGHKRALRNGLFNEPMLASILDEVSR